MGKANVTPRRREVQLPLFVTKVSRIGIQERDGIQAFGISLNGLHQLGRERRPVVSHQHEPVPSVIILNGFSTVFSPELGKSKGLPVRIEVKDQATPKFHKVHQVPFALLPKADEAIERLVEQGIFCAAEAFPVGKVYGPAYVEEGGKTNLRRL